MMGARAGKLLVFRPATGSARFCATSGKLQGRQDKWLHWAEGVAKYRPVSAPEASSVISAASDVEQLSECAIACEALRIQIGKVVVGQQGVVDSLLISLLARGHALLVGVPGLAKTLLVSTMAESLGLSFGRVQFTPDLLPADITGTDVLAESASGTERELTFLPGPIFQNLVLADEINRTPPKTQAALLQAMQEGGVTAGTTTHALPDPFLVFATRNPIEQEGTYVLPEAQLDRFLLEIHVDYPSEAEELQIARQTTGNDSSQVERVVGREQVLAFAKLVRRIPCTEEAYELAVKLARCSRPGPHAPDAVTRYVRFGAGPRGSQSLIVAAKARAAMRGDAAADVEDIAAVMLPTLRHRLVLGYRAEADGVSGAELVGEIARACGMS